ncbi:MAG: bifunctional riboflavin kinase/FAD synthetase [Rhizobiales bacterium]|nr:bifunctional riboflavin kinase/FAD synthetase [Hyphomicrobiales bacterium]
MIDAVPLALGGGAVVIGNFDGVHRGHQALLARTIADAHRIGGPSLVLTFEPNPRTFFRPDEPVFRLTPPRVRARLLSAIGLDGLVIAPFDAALSALSPLDFVQSVLVDRLRVRSVTVGDDFRFGAKRAGCVDDLVAAGARLGFDVDVVAPVIDGSGARFSSSAIRAALVEGDIAQANACLGYRWFVEGQVIPGEQRGRELGFPTANVRLPADCGLRHGIYAVTFTGGDGVERAGVASYGRRPQFDNGAPLLETYVLDYRGDLYGQEVVVTFTGWIRPELKFASVEALVVRMGEDVAEAREILSRAGPGTPLDEALRHLPAPARL